MTTRRAAIAVQRKLPPPGARLRQAVVTAVVTGPPHSVTLNLGGDTTAIPGVRYLTSYTPSVGHTVMVLQSGPDLLVLGILA